MTTEPRTPCKPAELLPALFAIPLTQVDDTRRITYVANVSQREHNCLLLNIAGEMCGNVDFYTPTDKPLKLSVDTSSYYRGQTGPGKQPPELAGMPTSDHVSLKDPYREGWPLEAQPIDVELFYKFFAQIVGEKVFAKHQIWAMFGDAGLPQSVMMPAESRKYNWDQALLKAMLKAGVTRSKALEIQSDIVAYKRSQNAQEHSSK